MSLCVISHNLSADFFFFPFCRRRCRCVRRPFYSNVTLGEHDSLSSYRINEGSNFFAGIRGGTHQNS